MTFTIPVYKSKTKRAIPPVWSDGYHMVRPATPKDRHPMRWVATFHKGIPSKLMRHAETEQEAIEIAKRATAAMKKTARTTEGSTSIKKSRAQSAQPRPTEAPPSGSQAPDDLPRFSTYHFDCISANPIAQVWQCHSLPGEQKQVGAPRKDGRANKQAPFNHTHHECAVLRWREPVRNDDGSVRVFSRQEAELFALDLYYDTPEDERLEWQEGHKKVYATEHVDILFDPAINGRKTPFNLLAWWAPGQSKVVKDAALKKTSYTKTGRMSRSGTFVANTPDAAAALAFSKKLADMATDESRQLTDKDATFATIWRAYEYAVKHIEPTIPQRKRLVRL